jgi:hypothetical protein
MFCLIEDDGHNCPILHRFRDPVQAAEYIGYEPDEEGERLEQQGEYIDDDLVRWIVADEIPVLDHTEEG